MNDKDKIAKSLEIINDLFEYVGCKSSCVSHDNTLYCDCGLDKFVEKIKKEINDLTNSK